MSEIKLNNIYKSYDKQTHAVKDFNLNINDGEFIVLVGPSGCGKSTTLRMIAGLEDITDGDLIINGEVANKKAPKDRDLAMVFQDFALYPNMTVYKNLMYPLKMHKVDKQLAKERIQDVADMLGLEDLLDRKPGQLSGGQKQRVALGRAIVREPNAFLMDEPLSNLDAKLRVDMRYEISQIHQKLGTTIIYVTHDQTEAMTMADRMVVMNDGEIQQLGTPKEIYENPANIFVAEFIGVPKINILPRSIKDGQIQWAENSFINLNLQGVPNQEAKLGVRPENLNLVEGKNYTVTLVENLGSENHVYLEGPAEDGQIIAKVSNDHPAEVGETYDLEIKHPTILNVFSSFNGQALAGPHMEEPSREAVIAKEVSTEGMSEQELEEL